MRLIWDVMRMESRLAWRRPTFWVVQGLWLLPLALTATANLGNRAARPAAPFVGEQLVNSLMIWLVLLPLFVGPALTRDLGEAGETLWTTPLDALAHGIGVVGGLLLALVPALVGQLAAQWLVGMIVVGPPAVLFWRFGPPLFLAGTMVGVSAAAVLALILRRTLLLLLVWVALWAVVLQVNLGALRQVDAVGLLSPVNIFFYDLQLSPSLGLGLARPLVEGLVLWFIGLGVLGAVLAVGVAVAADRRRAIHRGRSFATCIMVAGLLAGSGGLLHARAVRAQAIALSPADIQTGVWRVEAHTLDVSIDRARRMLVGASTLRLAMLRDLEAPHVMLRLNPGLRLIEARNAAGQALAWERVGDSVVVRFPAVPTAALTLRLRWEGTPRPAYSDYGQGQGSSLPAYNAPQPVRALLTVEAGYLFRDGDWYPWPWSSPSVPQQAAMSRVTLRLKQHTALTTAPLADGVVRWEGRLPPVLLVLPPTQTLTVAGRVIHVGHLGGTENVFMTRLAHIARLLPMLGHAVNAAPVPIHIVVLPYLNTLVWAGNMLLVPEDGNLVPDDVRRVLFAPSSMAEGNRGIEDRALMTALARAWLASRGGVPSMWARVRPDVQGVVAFAGIPGQPGVVSLPGAPDDPHGRWITVPATIPLSAGTSPALPDRVQDLRTVGNPPLVVNDYLELVALWLALELADPAVREADLAVLLAPPDPGPASDKFEPFLLRALPFTFPVSQARKAALIDALHRWAEQVGREQALRLVGAAMQSQAGSFNLTAVLNALQQKSGVPIMYKENP